MSLTKTLIDKSVQAAIGNIPQTKTRTHVIDALKYAQSFLRIRARDFACRHVINYYEPDPYHIQFGRYDFSERMIYFMGMPLYETIFHESVHFWQHEHGDNFQRNYLVWNSWDWDYEIEAREISVAMVREYFKDNRIPALTVPIMRNIANIWEKRYISMRTKNVPGADRVTNGIYCA